MRTTIDDALCFANRGSLDSSRLNHGRFRTYSDPAFDPVSQFLAKRSALLRIEHAPGLYPHLNYSQLLLSGQDKLVVSRKVELFQYKLLDLRRKNIYATNYQHVVGRPEILAMRRIDLAGGGSKHVMSRVRYRTMGNASLVREVKTSSPDWLSGSGRSWPVRVIAAFPEIHQFLHKAL